MKNLYKILGVKKTSSPEEIKKAYYELAKKYHPDSTDKSEVQKFYEVTEAYQILSDIEERRAYDLAIGGGKIESVLVEEEPDHPTIFKKSVDTAGFDEDFRKKEMHSFKKRILLQGGLRVIGFAIFLAVIGCVLAFIFDGNIPVSLVAGFAVGLVWGISHNFDVSSFFYSPKKRLLVRIIGWLLFAGGIGWFIFMVAGNFA